MLCFFVPVPINSGYLCLKSASVEKFRPVHDLKGTGFVNACDHLVRSFAILVSFQNNHGAVIACVSSV